MATDIRIERFVEVFLRTVGAGMAPGVPDSMLASEPDAEGWAAWRPIDSPVNDAAIEKLESDLGLRLPVPYKALLKYKCLLMTDFGTVSIPELRPDAPLRSLDVLISYFRQSSFLMNNMLFPFGKESRIGDLACFDTRQLDAEGDCPVVFVDTYRMNMANYQPIERWRSFTHFLEETMSQLLSYE